VVRGGAGDAGWVGVELAGERGECSGDLGDGGSVGAHGDAVGDVGGDAAWL
jgi:hypothetical protein